MIRYVWRRSADVHPVLYLDVVTIDDDGWRLESFPAYLLIADMAKEMNR